MKIRISQSRRAGKVLFTVLVIAVLAGMVIAALLVLAQQHHYLTARSATWCSEIPIAEAGIEEAMTHLNSKPKRYATNGWAYSGNAGISKRGTNVGDGYYYTTIYTNKPLRILSVGYARIPRQTNYTSRSVLTFLDYKPPVVGIIGIKGVTMGGTAVADSFNSTDTNYSTGGLYDPNKRLDHAGVGTLATNKPSISTGSAKIYGTASTGPGGTVSGNIGDGDFLAGGGSGIQDGHVRDDFNMNIASVPLPSSLPGWNGAGRAGKTSQTIGGVTYEYVYINNDYEESSLSLNGTKGDVYIKGDVRLWIKGDLSMHGSPKILMAPNATLRLYIGGSLDMSGQCVFNTGSSAGDCTIYGLPTCTSMKLAGGADLYMQVYAPQADVKMSGNFDFSGSLVGKSIDCTGLAGIHYDEAFGVAAGQWYWITSWEEL